MASKPVLGNADHCQDLYHRVASFSVVIEIERTVTDFG